MAHWLAARFKARLLLTARTPLPPRGEWDKVLAEGAASDAVAAAIRKMKEMEQAGCEVLVAAADAASLDQMGHAIECARARWGAIDGVVHAAGLAGNGRVAFLKSPEDVTAVLSPKTGGLAVLLQLLGNAPLDFVALDEFHQCRGWRAGCLRLHCS